MRKKVFQEHGQEVAFGQTAVKQTDISREKIYVSNTTKKLIREIMPQNYLNKKHLPLCTDTEYNIIK
jgi:hypothetical protein